MADTEEQNAGAVEEPEETPGYKPPAEASLEEIRNKDREDESLEKYKEMLLGKAAAGGDSAIVCKYHRKWDISGVAYEHSSLCLHGLHRQYVKIWTETQNQGRWYIHKLCYPILVSLLM